MSRSGALVCAALTAAALARPAVTQAAEAPEAAAPATASATGSASPPPAPIAPVRPLPPAPVDASPVAWRWRTFEPFQVGILLEQSALVVTSLALPGHPGWTATNAFDEAGREALHARSYDALKSIRSASDAGVALLAGQQLVDMLLVAWWAHGEGTTGLQMGLLDVQTVTFAVAVQGVVAGAVGRERPFGRSICGEGGFEPDASACAGNDRYRSFFSGHSTTSFALATLACVHHAQLPLYGGGAAEAAPCAAALTTAAGVALMRVASDQHYLSDVMTGAAFGVASGLAVPWLFAYGHARGPAAAAERALGVSSLSLVPAPGGAALGGAF